jgi:hypothetical protein
MIILSARAFRRRRPAVSICGLVTLTLVGVLVLSVNGQALAGARGTTSHASRKSGRAHRAHRAPTSASRGHALKMIWGPLTMPNGSSAFPVYHRLGVQVLEVQLSWANTAPTRPAEPTNPADPAYHWPQALDTAAAEASRYGISLAIMVKGAPEWSNGGREISWAPNNPADFANFMQAASRHYSTVHYWMIWGEVTREGNFNPMPPNSPVGPERYALLLEAAYGALKSVSPSNIVIGGMTFTVGIMGAPEFIKRMRLPDGAPPRMDYYGHNPYSTRYPKLSEPYEPQVRDIDDIETLHDELADAYRGHGSTPKLWLSEFGISSNKSNRAFDYYVSRPVQAQWLTAAFKLADSVPYVAGLGWYDLLDEPSSVSGNLTEGLMTENGTPKPAFYAYQKVPAGH